MDGALLGTDPPQLLLAGDRAPEAPHVGGDGLERPPDDDRRQRVDRRHAHLGPAAEREREAVALEVVARIGPQDDVRGGIVGRRVHRVGTGQGARGGEAHVVSGGADDAAHA